MPKAAAWEKRYYDTIITCSEQSGNLYSFAAENTSHKWIHQRVETKSNDLAY